VGKPMVLDGKNYTIVGVMPQAFQFPVQNEPVELFLDYLDIKKWGKKK